MAALLTRIALQSTKKLKEVIFPDDNLPGPPACPA